MVHYCVERVDFEIAVLAEKNLRLVVDMIVKIARDTTACEPSEVNNCVCRTWAVVELTSGGERVGRDVSMVIFLAVLVVDELFWYS